MSKYLGFKVLGTSAVIFGGFVCRVIFVRPTLFSCVSCYANWRNLVWTGFVPQPTRHSQARRHSSIAHRFFKPKRGPNVRQLFIGERILRRRTLLLRFCFIELQALPTSWYFAAPDTSPTSPNFPGALTCNPLAPPVENWRPVENEDVARPGNGQQTVGLQPEVGHRALGQCRRDVVLGHRRPAAHGPGGPHDLKGAPGGVDQGTPTNDPWPRGGTLKVPFLFRSTPSSSFRTTSRQSTSPSKFSRASSRPGGGFCRGTSARGSRSTSSASSSRRGEPFPRPSRRTLA